MGANEETVDNMQLICVDIGTLINLILHFRIVMIISRLK